jgi:hypothetical protein
VLAAADALGPPHARATRVNAPTTARTDDDFEVIRSLATLRDVQEGRGFAVITDDANPTRLHRAGCRAIREENCIRNVIENHMRSGKYLFAEDAASARRRWQRMTEHACVAKAETSSTSQGADTLTRGRRVGHPRHARGWRSA